MAPSGSGFPSQKLRFCGVFVTARRRCSPNPRRAKAYWLGERSVLLLCSEFGCCISDLNTDDALGLLALAVWWPPTTWSKPSVTVSALVSKEESP